MEYNDRKLMRKKGLVPDSSASILLTLPEGTDYQPAVNAFLENQDFHSQLFFFNPTGDTVTIGLVRELLRHSSFARAESEPQTLVICAVHTATVPAQNALLKIVEEPPPNTQIILAANPGRVLLPTLISRCREIIWAEPNAAPTPPPVYLKRETLETFLKQPETFSYHDLVELAGTFKDTLLAQQTLRSIIREYSDLKPAKVTPDALQRLLEALEALEKNGNVKLVMEHCLFNIKQHTAFS